MMRTIVAALVALVVGVAVGAVVVHGQLAGPLDAAMVERDALAKQCAALEKELAGVARRAERLEKDNVDYAEQYDALQGQMTALRKVQRQQPVLGAEPGVEETPPMEVAEAPAGKEEERSEREKEWRERRQEMGARMREGVYGFLAEQAEQETDPAARARLESMAEYSDYLFDLRVRMREAETEEDREALRVEMERVGIEAHALTREQQDHVLRQAAEAWGVKAGKQDKFAAFMREVMSSPYFRFSPGGFGGRRGGAGRDGGRGRRGDRGDRGGAR